MITSLIAGLLSGLILGYFYFWSLWFTVRRFTLGVKYARELLVVSFLVRTLVVLLGFYVLLEVTAHWVAVGLALIGFVISRIVITKIVFRKTATTTITDESVT